MSEEPEPIRYEPPTDPLDWSKSKVIQGAFAIILGALYDLLTKCGVHLPFNADAIGSISSDLLILGGAAWAIYGRIKVCTPLKGTEAAKTVQIVAKPQPQETK